MASISKIIEEARRRKALGFDLQDRRVVAELADDMGNTFPVVWKIIQNEFYKPEKKIPQSAVPAAPLSREPIKKKETEKMGRFKMTQEIYDEITAYREDGLTWVEIAERVGHSNFKSLNSCYAAFGRDKASSVKTSQSAMLTAPLSREPEKAEKVEEFDTMKPTVKSVLDVFGYLDFQCDEMSVNYINGDISIVFERDGRRTVLRVNIED